MKEINVKIPEEYSNWIERLFFEWNAAQNIIGFLMSRNDINEEYLNKYLDATNAKYTELEIAKRMVSREFAPSDITEYNYSFDFDEHAIIYKVA